MIGTFPAGVFVDSSPIAQIRYHRRVRRAFLFGALRTHSLMAREELAEMVAPVTATELVEILKAQTVTGTVLVPGQHASKVRRNRRILKFLRFGVGRRALFDLAWLFANQNIDEQDLVHAKTVYSFCEKKYGLSGFSHMHLIDLALVNLRLGELDAARKVLAMARTPLSVILRFSPKRLAMKPALGFQEALNEFFGFSKDLTIRPQFLNADITNPFRGQQVPPALTDKEVTSWLSKLSKSIIPGDVAALAFASTPGLNPYDALTVSGELKPVTSGPRVTVVMSSYKPGEHLILAAKSVLASSYQNIELLIIDDASGKDFESVLARAHGLDDRVQVLHQKENGGTYRIRNRALDEATGELITFHDSDDWLHPQRIEKQVARLLGNDRIGNISMATRLTDKLEASESVRRLRIGLCEPSLMFWKDRALEKVGYFDTVRKGGDSEYRRRLERAFSQDLEVIDPFRCLTIQRADNGGLTAGDLGFRWIVDFRLTYRDSFNHFQRTKKSYKYDSTDTRHFYAPRPMLIPRSQEQGRREIDLVIGANCHDPKNAKQFVGLAKAAITEGKSVALWQINCMYPLSNPRTIRADVLEMLNSGEIETVYSSDQLMVEALQLIAPSAFLNSFHPLGYRWQIKNRSLLEGQEGWDAKGEGIRDEIAKNFNQIGD